MQMATLTLKKQTITVKVNAGTDSSGNIKTANLNFPNLSELAFEGGSASSSYDKALAVVTALAPCLSKTITAVEGATTNTISAA